MTSARAVMVARAVAARDWAVARLKALGLALLKGCDLKGVYWGSFAERDPEARPYL